eukprot:scaffold52028_cov74-Phaeocystis_antarctica.AAC.5
MAAGALGSGTASTVHEKDSITARRRTQEFSCLLPCTYALSLRVVQPGGHFAGPAAAPASAAPALLSAGSSPGLAFLASFCRCRLAARFADLEPTSSARSALSFSHAATASDSLRSSSKSRKRASSLVRYPRYVWKSLRRRARMRGERKAEAEEARGVALRKAAAADVWRRRTHCPHRPSSPSR